MTTAWRHWTKDIAERLSEQLETTVEPTELVMPPDRKLGDIAFGCFRLAKERKQSPADLANAIATKFEKKNSEIMSSMPA